MRGAVCVDWVEFSWNFDCAPMDPTPPPQRFRLDLASGQLFTDDARIPLTPKLFSMLRFFAENPGRLITRQELLDQLWPETHVTEALVKDYVRKIRKVLNDDAERPHFIETARGMGYRLIGDIPVLGQGPMPDEEVAAVSIPTIAVLPFADASDGGDQAYFATGISEDIIAVLARFRTLIVIARDTSFLYDTDPPDLRLAGRRLAVDYFVKGNVRRAGPRVRINVQMIEAENDRLIWAENYDRQLEDIFAIQDDVAKAVVTNLVGHIEESGRQRAARRRSENLIAYEHLLLGNWHLRQGTEPDVAKARVSFQRAIDLEPTYARAHAEMAFSYLVEFWSDWAAVPEAAVKRAFALAQQATTLDDFDSRGHLYLAAAYHFGQSNFAAAEREYDKAIDLNPNDYDAFCLRSWLLALSGKPDEGIACAEHALRLSPLTTEDCHVAQCLAAYSARRYKDALAALVSIAEPTVQTKALLAMCHAQLGQKGEAKRAMRDFLAALPPKLAEVSDGHLSEWRQYWTMRYPFKDQADLRHMLEGLTKAGMRMDPLSDRA